MEQFRTKDIYEAGALIAADLLFVGLEPGAGFYWFVFDDETACRKVADTFWSNRLRVSAKDYAEAIRSLKDRLFANK